MRTAKLTRRPRSTSQDRADMLAAPTILLAMLMLATSVLRPEMADAPTSFVVLSLGACGLLFITLLALYFERNRFGLDRWLLAGTAVILLTLGLFYRTTLSPTLVAMACGLPAAACVAAWVILGNGRRV